LLVAAVNSAAACLGAVVIDNYVPAIAPVNHRRPRLVQGMDEDDEKVIHSESL